MFVGIFYMLGISIDVSCKTSSIKQFIFIFIALRLCWCFQPKIHNSKATKKNCYALSHLAPQIIEPFFVTAAP